MSPSDPFAGLPRLTSFRLPDLPPGVETATAPAGSSPNDAAVGGPSGYVGRRRHGAEEIDAPPARTGRHGSDSEAERPAHRR